GLGLPFRGPLRHDGLDRAAVGRSCARLDQSITLVLAEDSVTDARDRLDAGTCDLLDGPAHARTDRTGDCLDCRRSRMAGNPPPVRRTGPEQSDFRPGLKVG